jgi:uncharacterized RDD family membrane protein YckC
MAARATAVIIDALVTLVVLGPLVGLATGQAHHSGGTASINLHGWPALLWIVVSLGYWIACEHLWGMTLGKRLFSIRVTSHDGLAPTWGQSATRNILRLVDGFPYLVPYLLGFVVAEGNEDRQRLGDKAARTRVVTWNR